MCWTIKKTSTSEGMWQWKMRTSNTENYEDIIIIFIIFESIKYVEFDLSHRSCQVIIYSASGSS